MTTLKRKKPAAAKQQPWPSDTITPRITDDGRVAGHAGGPISALWEEALGRWEAMERGSLDYEEHQIVAGEVKGLVVAISALSCITVDQGYERLAELLATTA